MATEHRQRLNIRINSRLPRLLKLRAERLRNASQAYGARVAEWDSSPTRDAFVARLVRDMTDLMPEFEQSLKTGCR